MMVPGCRCQAPHRLASRTGIDGSAGSAMCSSVRRSRLHNTSMSNPEIAALVRGIGDVRPQPWLTRLKDWGSADGKLAVKQRIEQRDGVAVAQGTLGLEAPLPFTRRRPRYRRQKSAWQTPRYRRA